MERTFAQKIIHWYSQNKRDLPWRKTNDPYKIWLSEIILQQTRVAQGTPYYLAFIEKYPDIFDLAHAQEQEVLKLWQGLGYYSRAINLHFTAQYIVKNFNGKFPSSYDKLLKLKGIGDYTAAAIASFCFDESVPVIDGNVFRVLSRYFGIETPINENKAKIEFKTLAKELIDKQNPGIFNQAMMEFGALQCTPLSPLCNSCPLNDSCAALQNKKVSILPIKSNKIASKKRYFNYIIYLTPNRKTIIEKRNNKDIWKHLFQFPLIESDKELDIENFIDLLKLKNSFSYENSSIQLINPRTIKHKLTHQEIFIKFWTVEIQSEVDNAIYWDDLHIYPFPIIIHRFIEIFPKDL